MTAATTNSLPRGSLSPSRDKEDCEGALLRARPSRARREYFAIETADFANASRFFLRQSSAPANRSLGLKIDHEDSFFCAKKIAFRDNRRLLAVRVVLGCRYFSLPILCPSSHSLPVISNRRCPPTHLPTTSVTSPSARAAVTLHRRKFCARYMRAHIYLESFVQSDHPQPAQRNAYTHTYIHLGEVIHFAEEISRGERRSRLVRIKTSRCSFSLTSFFPF